MITLNFTKNFVGGALDGLTYEDKTTFATLELAEEFIGRGLIKGIGADFTISNPVLTINLKINGWTTEMVAIGRGAFPYDCASKNKYPNAMIYQDNNGGWVGDYQIEDSKLGYYLYK